MQKKRRALITGITGQDGSYLAEYLVEKGYDVWGLMRRTSLDPLMRIHKLADDRTIKLRYGNLRDTSSLQRALEEAKPDEVYNLAAVSPYAEAKLMAYKDFVKGYREQYGYFVASGILFNHESPKRGEHFVTRKITVSLAKIKLGLQKGFSLGNLEARRDWGYAGDYIKAMHLMLQQKKPEDFVIATGESHTVRDFVEAAASALGMPIHW